MIKRYEIKTYWITTVNVPKKTFSFISWNKEAASLKTDIRFDWVQNWWQWAMRLTFNKPFNYGDFDLGDIIRVRAYDQENLLGEGVYSWYINGVKRRVDSDGESIELTMYGLSALMNTIIAWGGILNYTNTDPSIIMTDLLNQFNSNYPYPLITFDPIPLVGTSIDFRVDDTTIISAMQQLHEVINWIFYVDWDGKFSTQPRWTTPDHIFTLKYGLNILEKNEDRSDIVTRVYFTVTNFINAFWIDDPWTPWDPLDPPTTKPIIVESTITYTFDNLVAQATYWIIEKIVKRLDLYVEDGVLSPGIEDAANSYLEEHSKPKNFLRLALNNKVDYLKVKPWDLIRVKNIDFTIADALVNKINYSSTGLSVDCEKTIDFASEVVNS